jgi:signal transduction histidine kinase
LVRTCHIIAAALATLFCLPVHGQDAVTLYNETNGLPRSSINDIEREGNGLIWLATERGLIRFDGRNFIEVSPKQEGYRNQEVSHLNMHGKRLYLVYRDSGCMVLDLQTLRFRLFMSERLDDIVELPDGDCVAITRNGDLTRLHRGVVVRRVRYGSKNPAILSCHQGVLMASLPTLGIVLMDDSTLQPIRRFTPVPEGYMDAFIPAGERLYHLSNGGLMVFDRSRRYATPSPFPELRQTNITRFSPTPGNRAYLIADNKRLLEQQAGRVRPIALPGLQNLELRRLYVQDTNHLLIGTNQGLLHVRMGSNPTTRLLESAEDTARTIRVRRSILETSAGRLLMLGSPRPFSLDLRGGFQQHQVPRADMYDAVMVGDVAYVTTEGRGLIELNPRSWTFRTITAPPLISLGFYFSILHDSAKHSLIVGGTDKIILYDISRREARAVSLPPGTGFIQALLRDSLSGRLWIGAENALICMDPGLRQIVFLARTGKAFRGRWVAELLARTGTRELWVGHEHGVDIVDMDSFRFRATLPETYFRNHRVVSMLEDLEGRIWIGTYSGIVGYDPRIKGLCRLNRENGLLNIEFNYKSALRLSDGRLIFGGLNGYDLIDPGRIHFTGSGTSGIVTGLHRFSVNDTIFEPLPKVAGTIGFNTRDEFLRIYLSSANTLEASRHSYEYDLDGKGQWIGISGPSHINLLRLDPGLHSLDIRGFDEYGRVLGFERLVIRAREPFLSSRLFQILLSIAAICFLTLFIAALLRSRQKEKALKERISMDLHDEVGTILTRALYVARGGGERQSDSRVIHYLNESLFSLRAYINTMNTPSFPFRALVDEVREMTHSLMGQSPCVPMIRHRELENPMLSGELYRDIRLCLYEIINNTLKHSQADSLRILLFVRGGYLTVYTLDNGVLRAPEELGDRGNGLRNLRKRVSKHDGLIQFGVGKTGNGLWIRMRFGIMT